MSSRIRWRGLVFIGAIATTAYAGDESPPLMIQWSVDDGATNLVLPGGTHVGDAFVYEGVASDPGTGLELSYTLTATPWTKLRGNVHIFNAFDEPITVNADIRLPF